MTGTDQGAVDHANDVTAARPRFSIVSAVYNVAPYLPDFFASIEGQSVPPEDIEVVVVDDGSTDDSLAVLEAWRERASFRVVVLHQENAGQAAARNAGLDHATGEWVTFTDPDDALDPQFLFALARFARQHPEVEMLVPRVLSWDDARDRLLDRHPRRAQLAKGTRVVDLDTETNAFGTATVSAFRLDRIQRLGVRYDVRLRPSFEDAHFSASYLLTLERPLIGVVRGAKYRYRRREAMSSATQTAWSDPAKFTTVFEHGYLDLLARSRAADGHAADWVQQLVVYELVSLLLEHDRPGSRVRIPADVHERFRELFAATTAQLEPSVVRAHRVRRLRPVWADLIIHGSSAEPWHAGRATETRVDRRMGLRRVAYRYTGPRPDEEILRAGVPFEAPWSKHVSWRYFDEPMLSERVLWLPLGDDIELRVQGAAMPIRPAPVPRANERYHRRPKGRRAKVRRYLTGEALRAWPKEHPTAVADAVLRVRSAVLGLRRYRGAWVLMDRVHDADDNAERLFEHLRHERRDINAWFVLEEGTPDWARMRLTHGSRVVAYGSETWRALLRNAEWLISSHSDQPIANPSPVLRTTNRVAPWKLAFLQHGVIKDDLSPWLNNYPHDLIVTSTEPEYHSLVDDGTSYAATAKEVRLTGLPRFDRLLRKGAEVRPADRDLVLVGPTWRSWLSLPLRTGSQRRETRAQFWESEYLRAWMALLASPEIADAVARRGWRLGFMPHPNLQHVLDELSLPAHVEPIEFHGEDVQGLYARLGLFVTDYSSVAFNAAYLDRPSVYYQFDRDAVLGGLHVGRPGYFSYEEHGFGPVATTHEAAVAAIVASIERGPVPGEPYAARIATTFPDRDGGACARVVAALEELSRPWNG